MFNILFKKFNNQGINHDDRPRQVSNAVAILYAAFILSMITDWLDGITLVPFLIVFVLVSLVITATSAGKKWARIIVLVFVIINLLSFGFYVAQLFVHTQREKYNNLVVALFSAEIVIELISMRLLFSRPANVWFNEQNTRDDEVEQ